MRSVPIAPKSLFLTGPARGKRRHVVMDPDGSPFNPGVSRVTAGNRASLDQQENASLHHDYGGARDHIVLPVGHRPGIGVVIAQQRVQWEVWVQAGPWRSSRCLHVWGVDLVSRVE